MGVFLASLELPYISLGQEDSQAWLCPCQYLSGAEIWVPLGSVAKFPIWMMLHEAAKIKPSPRTSGKVPGAWLIPLSHHPQATLPALQLHGHTTCFTSTRALGVPADGHPPVKARGTLPSFSASLPRIKECFWRLPDVPVVPFRGVLGTRAFIS